MFRSEVNYCTHYGVVFVIVVISLSSTFSSQLNVTMYCSDTDDRVTLQGSKLPASVSLNSKYIYIYIMTLGCIFWSSVFQSLVGLQLYDVDKHEVYFFVVKFH